MTDASRTTDKRRLRGEESCRLILQAAVDCIASDGLSRLTLDRVAERVGISRGLVVFHFKSKNNLIEEVLEFLSAQYSGGWYELCEAKGVDDVSKLLSLVEYDVRFACDYPKYVSAWHAFWGDSRGNQLFHDLVVPRDEGYASDLAQLLERISEAGGYDIKNVPTITRGLMALMFGIWVLKHLNPKGEDCSADINLVHHYLQKMFPNTEIPPKSSPG